MTNTPLAHAVLYRDGLMILCLACRPMRLSNFGSMTLGRHLVRNSCGYWLQFEASEMKGRRPFDAGVLPNGLTCAFDRYLDHHRAILLTRGGRSTPATTNALWISAIGTAMNPLSIPNRIKKHTRAAFGRHLWVHLFRDCSATTIAIQDPEHSRIIMSILAQTSIATSEKHDIQSTSLEASRRYQKILGELLDEIEEQIEQE